LLVDRIRAETLIQLGRIDEAESIVQQHLEKDPADDGGSFSSVKALILARRENTNASTDAIGRCVVMEKGYGHFHHTAYNIASAYAVLNSHDHALKWLEAAADNGFPCYPYFAIDPNLDNLRATPRFTSYMSELHTQWQRFHQIV
jgi:tetratricopeptide (TPR) repeat protein